MPYPLLSFLPSTFDIVSCAWFFSAASAVKQALQLVEKDGTILLFAPTEPGIKIPISVNRFWARQITLTTTYAAAPKDIEAAIELIRHRTINVHDMITHRLSLDETEYGFQLVAEAQASLKVIVEPCR